MIKVKSQELKGAALDWVVAQIADREVVVRDSGVFDAPAQFSEERMYCPSMSWELSGEIIDTIEGWQLNAWPDKVREFRFEARIINERGDFSASGSTSLIAMMRCYVISIVGEEVKIPLELGSLHE